MTEAPVSTCMVTLTYDDGLESHVDTVGQLLTERRLRGTFYAPVQSDLVARPDLWKTLAAAGHELGNHSVIHPCTAADDAPWIQPWQDLATYDETRLTEELSLANQVLAMIDGKTSRTYGNTCCETSFGPERTPMGPILKRLFVGARGRHSDEPAPLDDTLDPFDVGCIGADWRSLDELVGFVDDARRIGGWAVFMIHGVHPDDHDWFLDPGVHVGFLDWLSQEPGIAVTTFGEGLAAWASTQSG